MYEKQERLQAAIEIATEAHTGQYRDNGEPYILHPIRVMMKMDTVQERTVAVLHDVVEDSRIPFEELATKLDLTVSSEIMIVLVRLTHFQNKTYDEYIKNIARCPMARKIKIADLEDNLNLSGYARLDAKYEKRARKHFEAYRYLKSHRL